MSGYVGKIARINLTTRQVSLIDTRNYEQWGGGHGIGSALFFDIVVKEKKANLEQIDGFHPDNVVTIMTSPMSATGVPSATARTEVQGIGVHAYPIGWFTRSMIGGRIGPMLKFAGYDGIAIEGASSQPVWIDIRDSAINIRPCNDLGLWRMDTVETQKAIHAYVAGSQEYGSWISPAGTSARTTQRPAVITIGRAGENRCRMACLMTDYGYAAGAGGFGAVFGAKNLKAVSVVGTGSVPVADPARLIAERIANIRDYGCDVANYSPLDRATILRHNMLPGAAEAYGKTPTKWDNGSSLRQEDKRPASCMGCYAGCRGRYKSGKANEVHCAGTYFYGQADDRNTQVEATDLINRYGFNTFDFYQGVPYLKALADKGIIGPAGSEIETDLDFSQFGSLAFAQRLLETIAERDTPFGDALAEGFARAVERWGRMEDIGDASEADQSHIQLPYWGLPEHHYDARAQLDYGFGTILGDREICEHLFTAVYWDWRQTDRLANQFPRPYNASALQSATLLAEKMLPHATDYYASTEEAMQMLDYSTPNMYSEHIARLVSWHRHFTRFWMASMLYCDWRYPDIINSKRADKKGASFTMEEIFFKAVTGKDFTFLDGMAIGRKIWNLDNVIWTLQGRHRDMVHFAGYIYQEDFKDIYKMTTYEPDANPQWEYRQVGGRHLDRNEFEGFKTRFYDLEGWDPSTGWPTESTLSLLGLGDAVEALAYWGKLGSD